MSKHFGHEGGAWFWGCDACNPVDATFEYGQGQSSMNISDEAVEALAKERASAVKWYPSEKAWADAPGLQEAFRTEARADLEAVHGIRAALEAGE